MKILLYSHMWLAQMPVRDSDLVATGWPAVLLVGVTFAIWWFVKGRKE